MKRFLVVIIIIIFIIIAVIIGSKAFNKRTNYINDIIPEEEISDSQLRKTILTLYFKNGNILVPEARHMDVKELINDPYYIIIKQLIDGPKNSNLEKTIPEGTTINSITKTDDNLIIDFSKEFIENHKGGEIEERLTIDSIVNTVTELTEINGVKILIEGEENKGYKDGYIDFSSIFKRIENE